MREIARFAVLLLLMAVGGSKGVAAVVPEMPSLALPKDTTRYGEDDWDDEDGIAKNDTVRKPRDMVKGRNILNEVMENRYIPDGETMRKSKSWMHNVYLQLGVSGEKITPPVDGYEFSMMPGVQLGVGKVLNKRHSVRLMGHGSWGYMAERDYKLSRYGLRAEYLYDLSSYFDGYNPTRQLNLSALVGVGGEYSKVDNRTGMSGEAHMGLQLRFFTGPQAYVSLEPYVGIATDQIDVSEKRNWRSTDIFYGVSLNYIYYLRSNLTQESWRRLIDNADSLYRANPKSHGRVSADGRLELWQQPWFVQFSSGPSLMKSPNLGMGETLGSEMAISGGKWLSPSIGLRATLFQRTNVWRKVASDAEAITFQPAYTLDRHNVYQGFRLEAMVNPLGFLNNFLWDCKWGFYLMGGYEKGWIQKRQSQPLSCSNSGWGGGLNLWYQPTEGLKLFVEPRYMHNEYSIPYTDVDWFKRYGDDNITFNIGVAIEQRDDKRFYTHSYEMEYVVDRLRTWTVGIGGGMNFLQTEGGYTGGAGLPYNGLLFGEYHIDRLKGVRLGVEYVGMKRTNLTDYTDYNMDFPEEGNAPVVRTGLWDHQYGLLLISPGALIDMNQLMMHYRPQRLRLSVFAGPTLAMLLRYKSQLSPLERLMEHHMVEPIGDGAGKLSFGAHIGFKLQYHLKKHISIHLTPTAYSLITTKLAGIDFTTLKLMETINVGAQYSF